MAVRYYSPDDPESYVTPSRLKRLGREKQIAYMVHWFHEFFWDPANDTPHDSSEGGYLYIFGGPYDADEELQAEFGDAVPFEVIQEAVQEVQSEGIYDWAPTSQHPDRKDADEEAMAEEYDASPLPTLGDIRQRLERGGVPSFGTKIERQERNTLRRELAELRAVLASEMPQYGGIGHNQPPEHLTLTPELNSEATDAIDRMDAELATDAPDIAVVVESAGTLQKILGWIGRKLDKSVDSFMTAIGRAAGVAVVGAVGAQLAGIPVAEHLGMTYRAALTWLDTIVSLPF